MEQQCIDEALTYRIHVYEGISTKYFSSTRATVKPNRDQIDPTNCELKAIKSLDQFDRTKTKPKPTKSLGLKLSQNPQPQILAKTMPNTKK